MKLMDILEQYTVERLKPLANFCDCKGLNKKADLIHCIYKSLTTLNSLIDLWNRLDPLSQKAVTAAYHNDGELNTNAFIAQYRALPHRPKKHRWSSRINPILLDLFLYSPTDPYFYYFYSGQSYNLIMPSDLLPLVGEIVPEADRFQIKGQSNLPTTTKGKNRKMVKLNIAETEQAGLHDLIAYLRLVDEGNITVTSSAKRLSLGSTKKHLMPNLLNADFLPLPTQYRTADTIRPFALDVFSQESGLVNVQRTSLSLSETGQLFYQTKNSEILLDAFERWTEQGSFDELSRISAIKRQNTKKTKLTSPAIRREAIVEALSWCPTGVWIDIEEFYRAIRIWHFDFDVEKTADINLQIEDGISIYNHSAYWILIKGSYINVLLWEYLGSIGAIDLAYIDPNDVPSKKPPGVSYAINPLSVYDGLRYFRINNLGAYLLGQASEYIPSHPVDHRLFEVAADLSITIINPNQLTPNDYGYIEQMAVLVKEESEVKAKYKLDTQQLLTTLENGGSVDHLRQFLQDGHQNPLPIAVKSWFDTIKYNSQLIKLSTPALLIKIKSTELAQTLINDPVLKRFCHLINNTTLVIPASRQKSFKARLKVLGYVLLS